MVLAECVVGRNWVGRMVKRRVFCVALMNGTTLTRLVVDFSGGTDLMPSSCSSKRDKRPRVAAYCSSCYIHKSATFDLHQTLANRFISLTLSLTNNIPDCAAAFWISSPSLTYRFYYHDLSIINPPSWTSTTFTMTMTISMTSLQPPRLLLPRAVKLRLVGKGLAMWTWI